LHNRYLVKAELVAPLNPKIAMLDLALPPQFIDTADGSVLVQSVVLGSIQIAISVTERTQ
jgi:threonine/homoserine/homoserine lactone efflux protein